MLKPSEIQFDSWTREYILKHDGVLTIHKSITTRG
jgi:hypothetical protein